MGTASHMRPAMPGMAQASGMMQHPGMQVCAPSSACKPRPAVASFGLNFQIDQLQPFAQ